MLDICRDAQHSDGVFVVVVGPDGVGKSTFAAHLLERWGESARYFHFRPPLRGDLHNRIPADTPQPKKTAPVSLPSGWARLTVAILRFWLSYLLKIRPAMRKGSLVVGDRWAYGYWAQPLAVRFGGPPWLARGALAVLPKPDLVFNLAAPPAAIRERKAELTIEEIAGELERWRSLPALTVTMDATTSPGELAEQAMDLLTR